MSTVRPPPSRARPPKPSLSPRVKASQDPLGDAASKDGGGESHGGVEAPTPPAVAGASLAHPPTRRPPLPSSSPRVKISEDPTKHQDGDKLSSVKKRKSSSLSAPDAKRFRSPDDNDPWADWGQVQNVQQTKKIDELEQYLSEETVPVTASFNILEHWKVYASKYPTLARMARDILAIPASTVASESAFSTGERVISDYRSSLASDTVEALICLQDCLRSHESNEDNIAGNLMEVRRRRTLTISATESDVPCSRDIHRCTMLLKLNGCAEEVTSSG